MTDKSPKYNEVREEKKEGRLYRVKALKAYRGKNSGLKKFVPLFVSINTAIYLQKNKKDKSRNV